jgi:hypothetical protein
MSSERKHQASRETRASQSLGRVFPPPWFYFYLHDGRNFCGSVVLGLTSVNLHLRRPEIESGCA